MDTDSLSYLATSVKNVALNRRLGFRFLVASGIEPVSTDDAESLLCDQLKVAYTMITSFGVLEASRMIWPSPWVELSDEIPTLPHASSITTKKALYENVIGAIHEQSKSLGDYLWDCNYPHSRTFFAQLAAQTHQGSSYLTTRINVGRLCEHLLELGEKGAKEGDLDIVLTMSPLGYELRHLFESQGSYLAGAQQLLVARRTPPPEHHFLRQLLRVSRELLRPEVIRRGYAVSE